jgi:hypothetical protein
MAATFEAQRAKVKKLKAALDKAQADYSEAVKVLKATPGAFVEVQDGNSPYRAFELMPLVGEQRFRLLGPGIDKVGSLVEAIDFGKLHNIVPVEYSGPNDVRIPDNANHQVSFKGR